MWRRSWEGKISWLWEWSRGPTVGELLRKLKAARLDGVVTDRAGEEQFVRELIQGGIS